ncbi:MAG: ATP-binding protein, partial [Bacteroidales bacterium]
LRAQEKGLDFKVITDLNLPMGIEIDEVRLRQILINLIGNAIKFTEKGSVRVHVSTLPTSTEHVDLKIEVKDTGIGIDPQHLQKIFEPFTQLENASTKRFGGTGLGLSITKRLVDLMGGEISVESEPNKGTTFTVLFKRQPCTSRHQQNLEMININPQKIKFHPALVIIADDVDNNRKYLKTVIQDTNLEVVESTNGLETFELARGRRPQLIISDLKMPGLNGFELLSKLRNDPLTRHIPVIATTATASIEEQDKLKVHRFDGILIKPIQVNDVYIELMRFLPHEIEEDDAKENTNDIAIVARVDSDIRVVKAILENELMTLWKNFEEQQPLAEVENFASQIRELGKKYELEILISYGNRLLMAVNNFDIDQMLKILADYPKLLSTFKVVTED